MDYRFGDVRRARLAPLFFLCCLAIFSPGWAEPPLRFNRDIRPILAGKCFACHGPDSASRKADLRLDQREAAVAAGALDGETPEESELLRRIDSEDPDEQMPPPDTKKSLSPEERELLRRWVSEGANYEPHWAYIPPVDHGWPETRDKSWARNGIDRFVLARLEQMGLRPAAEADKPTLARRLALDLTGLPPEPEILRTYLADESPEAYERLVETLLASPRWGEHQARYWLDAARYADSNGIHFDNFREIWSYRDWVVKAFNANMPFDQFLVEQLAGDLIPGATLDQRIASGFNRCNMTTNEGGAIDEEYLVLYTRDRTETVARVFMGLTANCAVCHDHKFDPLSQREFYQLSAYFNNTTQAAMDGNIATTPPVIVVPREDDRGRWSELEGALQGVQEELVARRESGRGDFQKWLASASADEIRKGAPSGDELLVAGLEEGDGTTTRVAVATPPGATAAGVAINASQGSSANTVASSPAEPVTFPKLVARDVPLTSEAKWESAEEGRDPKGLGLQLNGKALEIADVGDFEKDQPFAIGIWVKLHANDSSGAILARMDDTKDYRGWDLWNQERRVGVHIVDRWPDKALKVLGKNQIEANVWTHVAVTYDGSSKATGVRIYYNGQLQEPLVESDLLEAGTSIRTPVAFKLGQRESSNPVSGVVVRDLRIDRRAWNAGEVAALAGTRRFLDTLALAPEKRDANELEAMFAWWLTSLDGKYRDAQARQTALQTEQETLKGRGTIAHVMQEKAEPPVAYVLYRGEYTQRRDQVSVGTPRILPPFPADYPPNRLGLAKWLLLPDQPLTARVPVNRFWQHLFGTGLVRTSEDFGVSGELPTHPELLDWLALQFRHHDWDVKELHRLIVSSATYRQAAVATPEKLEKDPANRYFSRGPRFRMDAEMVRDLALATSGLLREELGGPSVKPYQPTGVWEAVAMIGSNTRDYRQDEGAKLYRRSLYTFWKRAAPPASMEILNAPSREFCVVRRERTNTPLQALVTLNDPQFVEAARQLAARVLGADPRLSGSSTAQADDERLRRITELLISRDFNSDERSLALDSLARLRAFYLDHPEETQRVITVGASRPDPEIPAAELAAWTMLANQLMNLDEVLNK